MQLVSPVAIIRPKKHVIINEDETSKLAWCKHTNSSEQPWLAIRIPAHERFPSFLLEIQKHVDSNNKIKKEQKNCDSDFQYRRKLNLRQN